MIKSWTMINISWLKIREICPKEDCILELDSLEYLKKNETIIFYCDDCDISITPWKKSGTIQFTARHIYKFTFINKCRLHLITLCFLTYFVKKCWNINTVKKISRFGKKCANWYTLDRTFAKKHTLKNTLFW